MIEPRLRISAVMPAFNEERNLERSVGALASVLSARARAAEIIVVNDGSRDGTGLLLARLAERYPTLRVVTHAVNQGYGAAVRSGFSAACYEWVFMMDSDNQFDPADVDLLLAHAPAADIVAGRRRHRRDPLARRLNAWAFFSLVTLLFGRLAHDVNCGFKLIRRDALEKMPLTSNGALINTELLVMARRMKARIVEVAVPHYPRTAGKPTGANLRVILRAFAELFALRAALKNAELPAMKKAA